MLVTAHGKLSKFWETVVLIMIGETLADSSDICGARILDKVSCLVRVLCRVSPRRKLSSIAWKFGSVTGITKN